MARYVIRPHQPPTGAGEVPPELGTIEATYSEAGDEVYYCSGYGARQIAQTRKRETGGAIYVNTVSRAIVRRDLRVTSATPVQYAVARGPVYTLIEHRGEVVRAYWPALEGPDV